MIKVKSVRFTGLFPFVWRVTGQLVPLRLCRAIYRIPFDPKFPLDSSLPGRLVRRMALPGEVYGHESHNYSFVRRSMPSEPKAYKEPPPRSEGKFAP